MSGVTPLKLAAGAVGTYALYAGYKRHKPQQMQAQVKTIAQSQAIYRNLARQQYTQGVSGNPHLDGLAKKWRNFKTLGPWGLNLKLALWKNKIKQFTNNVVWTPETLIGLTALYIGGFKPHKAITVPGKAIWQHALKDALGKSGNFMATRGLDAAGQLIGKTAKHLFTVPGLLVAGGLGAFLWRFNQVSNGKARVDFFNTNPIYTSYLYTQNDMQL